MAMTRTKNRRTKASPAVSPQQGVKLKAKAVIKLLTPAEEFDLVNRLSQMRDKIQRMLKTVLDRAPEGTRLDHFDQMVTFYQSVRDELDSRTVKKLDAALEEYKDIKETLVMSNLPWVTKLARGQRNTNINEEDLFQEGVCGLLKAIDRFEAERGLRLMTYATWYIREAMQQIRARQSHLVSISSHDQTLLGQLEAKQSAFQHSHNRLPTTKELGEGVKGNLNTIKQLQIAARPAVSLDRTSTEGSIPIPVDDPINEFEHNEEVSTAVSRLLESLPERERMIVTRRFGLDGKEPTSLEILGDDLNVSKERVRQLQRQALKRMQKAAAEDNVEVLLA